MVFSLELSSIRKSNKFLVIALANKKVDLYIFIYITILNFSVERFAVKRDFGQRHLKGIDKVRCKISMICHYTQS